MVQPEPMTRVEPAHAADERTSLDEFLDYHRATLLDRTEGLDAEALRQRLPTSELSLGGLLKHLALVEDDWIQVDFLGGPPVEPWASAPWDDDKDWEFHSADADDPAELRDLYRAACGRSRRALTGRGLDELSVGRDRQTGQPWSLRWILIHLIEETARHNGHADLLREAIDGRTGE
jgi:uncharacterized damage-inducible protein DinB